MLFLFSIFLLVLVTAAAVMASVSAALSTLYLLSRLPTLVAAEVVTKRDDVDADVGTLRLADCASYEMVASEVDIDTKMSSKSEWF